MSELNINNESELAEFMKQHNLEVANYKALSLFLMEHHKRIEELENNK